MKEAAEFFIEQCIAQYPDGGHEEEHWRYYNPILASFFKAHGVTPGIAFHKKKFSELLRKFADELEN